MRDLWPRLWHIRLSYELIGSSRTQFLEDAAFRALMNLVASAAAGLVWTYSEPGDGSLPDNDEQLARVARLTLRKWKKVRPGVEVFFIVKDGRWHLNEPWVEVGTGLRVGIPLAVQSLVAARQGARCTYCGSTDVPLEFDHIFPVSKGGTNDPSNLTLACERCNRSKGGLTLEEWVRGR